jgi:CBS domain containing-hemolysin-like protein
MLSAVFSASETALTSLSPLKRRKLEAEHPKSSQYIHKLFHKPGKMITTILVGNNVVNILASTISTFIFIDIMTKIGIENESVIAATSAIFMTIFLLIFGEITPKNVALINAEFLSIKLSRFIYYLSIILSPAIVVLNLLSKGILIITKGNRLEKGSLVSENEIKLLINLGLEEGVLEENEEKMLTSIFEFGDIIAREIMTPRPNIVAIEMHSTLIQTIKLINKYGHSRIPVYREKIDNIIGFIYAKDIFSVPVDKLESTDSLSPEMIRPAYYVPETKKIDELLNELRKMKTHIAIVVDEYGGTSGLVTLEDVIEEIIGEIHDEYDDKEEEMITKKNDGYVISGLMNVWDLNNELNLHLPEDEDYDSLAGFMVNRLGKMPQKGDVYEDERIKIQVLHIYHRRITKLHLIIKEGEMKQNG